MLRQFSKAVTRFGIIEFIDFLCMTENYTVHNFMFKKQTVLGNKTIEMCSKNKGILVTLRIKTVERL